MALLPLIFNLNTLFGEKLPQVYISYQKQIVLFMYFKAVLSSCCCYFLINIELRLEDA